MRPFGGWAKARGLFHWLRPWVRRPVPGGRTGRAARAVVRSAARALLRKRAFRFSCQRALSMHLLARLWRDNKKLVAFLFLMVLFRSAIADWNVVPSGSMLPTIREGDRILVDKIAYDLRHSAHAHRDPASARTAARRHRDDRFVGGARADREAPDRPAGRPHRPARQRAVCERRTRGLRAAGAGVAVWRCGVARRLSDRAVRRRSAYGALVPIRAEPAPVVRGR